MKILARGAFLLVTILWGSFYAVAKVALTHVDPILFTLFEALTLVPIALILLVMYRHTLTLAAVKRGFLLGSCLCIATLTITVSETFTGATNTAFFPSTGGTFAAVITAVVFGRSLAKSIWAACVLSLLGVLLLMHASLSGAELRGDVIALLGALLFTVYLFLVDQDAQHERRQFWAVVGIEHLSFAGWMLLFALLFGDWQHFHPVLAQDIPIVLYVALVCTFLPVLLTHMAQRYIDPLETGFISILEPIWGAIMAHVYLGEVVSLSMFVGGGLILAGTVVHLIGASDLPRMSRILISLLLNRVGHTSNTLKRWMHVVPTPSSILVMLWMFVFNLQHIFQRGCSSVRFLSIAWKKQQRALSGVLPLSLWFLLLKDTFIRDCLKALQLSWHVWHTQYVLSSFQSAMFYDCIKTRLHLFSSLQQDRSFQYISSSPESSEGLLTSVQACSPALLWHQLSQHTAPP